MRVDPPPAATAAAYRAVRARTVALCAPLAIEDHVPQPRPDVSPPKWHLGHTTWFFDTLVLQAAGQGAGAQGYGALFNSYYEALGERTPRHRRGHLSRPTVAEIHAYRAAVDAAMLRLLEGDPLPQRLHDTVVLGLHHEQQHQELLLTDLKVVLGDNPMRPPYVRPDVGRAGLDPALPDLRAEHAPARAGGPGGTGGTGGGGGDWLAWGGGRVEIGHDGRGFAYDNEGPRHPVHVGAAELRRHLVSNAEYLAFIDAGGYRDPLLWHAEGWDWVRREAVQAPDHWFADADSPCGWSHYTLLGPRPVEPEAPVTHVSYYEAWAWCQWAGLRLPTEFEWEALQARLDWGARWEWTASAYLPYPRFKPAPGLAAEYNAKFMVGQQVLRGASFATPPGHARFSYRNFFPAAARWQYTGIRPARDVDV